ncbi:MAG: hypothetical protein S4CHLAM20_09070 [Chlamydiia bacterium]|nr:hypothetical protein [Chlamydiia bacterium]
MQVFFQSFLPIVKAIESLMQQNKKPKISLKQDALHFYVVEYWEKGEQDKSAMEFFLFLKKRIATLDVLLLPKGERDALLETVSILETYIAKFLSTSSKVFVLLEKEIFSLRIGGLVPREYLNKDHEDLEFIKKNQLDKILFYHGVSVKYSPDRGIAFPVKGPQGTIREIYYSDLTISSLDSENKYFYNGEYFFSTDENGVLLAPLMIEDEALTIHNTNKAFMVYRSGYPEASMEIYRRDKELFLTLHDGKGAVYRFGIKNKSLVSPDQYVYKDEKGFDKIVIPCKEGLINACIEELYTSHFERVDDLVSFTLNYLDHHECINYYSLGNRILSYLFVPKIILKVITKELPWQTVFMPWKAFEIDYFKLRERGDELRKNVIL